MKEEAFISFGPRPHHMKQTLRSERKDNRWVVGGVFMFSSTYPSIADRNVGVHPHVNVMDIYAAVINIAHVAIKEFSWNLRYPRITETRGKFSHSILPDREYEGIFTVESLPNKESDKAVYGGKAIFHLLNEEGKVCSEITIEFCDLK